jgi:asparagine synthase (glutamine-hydrolysing)
MCGIMGIFNISSQDTFSELDFCKALHQINYRGPNANGIKQFNNNCIMGHLRLSIIDLNCASNQPFQIDDRYWITFNGEIYNYIELRDELIKLGYSFRTESDTEVLLRSYAVWGEDCVKRFNGMWAFAIYDQLENKMFCSRDRFGVKPFNYAYIDGQFIFGSEIKAILSYFPSLKVPNYNIIANYCRNSIGAQIKETWFKDIYRLPAAHNMVATKEGTTKYRYWNYPHKVNSKISFNEACNNYRKLLTDSVKLRMRSDVPVGFTISSGIDSTSIVCLLKNQFEGNRTYTASFDASGLKNNENTNFKTEINIHEPELVKRLASELGFSSNIVEVNFDHYVTDLQEIILHLESGHGSPAVFPLDKILNEATKEVTVVLEGQGADELLGGYISNAEPVYIKELIKKLKFKKALTELKAFTQHYSLKSAVMLMVRQSDLGFIKKAFYQYSGIDNMFSGPIKKFKWIKDHPREPKGFDNALNEHLFKSHTGGLVNLLHYGDAISMKHSLESRLPFMDYRLVEFAFTLPAEFKVQNGIGKYIHRKAMKGIVPDYILENKLKFGFDSPLAAIFCQTSSGSARSVLLSERCMSRGLFSRTEVEKCFNKHKEGHENNARLLYRMLNVELWFRNFIDEPLV